MVVFSKHADDMALVAYMYDSMDALAQYQLVVEDLVTTASEKSLEFNNTKTKELCFVGETRAATAS